MIASWGGQLVAPMKPKHKPPMHNEQCATLSSLEDGATEGKQLRASPEEAAQRKQYRSARYMRTNC